MAHVSQIGDGQVQGDTNGTVMMTTMSTSSDSPATLTSSPPPHTMNNVDAQSQPMTVTVTETETATVTKMQMAECDATSRQDPPPQTGEAVSQIEDGQVQGPMATGASSSDRMGSMLSPMMGSGNSTSSHHNMTTAFSMWSQNSSSSSSSSNDRHSAEVEAGEAADLVACRSNSTLMITLENGVLKDAHGRTGYIASNFQFQFDDPPQAGAIFTSGFSVCHHDAHGEDGQDGGSGNSPTLALGGSKVFWQCLSGHFYNIYDRHWAEQCSPVEVQVLELVDC